MLILAEQLNQYFHDKKIDLVARPHLKHEKLLAHRYSLNIDYEGENISASPDTLHLPVLVIQYHKLLTKDERDVLYNKVVRFHEVNVIAVDAVTSKINDMHAHYRWLNREAVYKLGGHPVSYRIDMPKDLLTCECSMLWRDIHATVKIKRKLLPSGLPDKSLNAFKVQTVILADSDKALADLDAHKGKQETSYLRYVQNETAYMIKAFQFVEEHRNRMQSLQQLFDNFI